MFFHGLVERKQFLEIDQKYKDIFEYIKIILTEEDNNATKIKRFPFRTRSEHIWRVFIWANRLIENGNHKNINKDALLTAALFHDAGYAVSPHSTNHAENGEKETIINENIYRTI